MRVEVLAFAALRDALGSARFPVDLQAGATGRTLLDHLAEHHPRWRDLLAACRIARGVEFLDLDRPLHEGDEVAVIPPVSGGTDDVPLAHLGTEPIDVRALRDAAHRPEAGAVCVFEGAARSPNCGQEIRHLEYEAHEPMARAVMERIVDEARRRWPDAVVYLHHRMGRIEIGETSVVAVASAVHRAEAFEACRFLIESLKADVPIWKKEVLVDGSVWVGAPGACH